MRFCVHCGNNLVNAEGTPAGPVGSAPEPSSPAGTQVDAPASAGPEATTQAAPGAQNVSPGGSAIAASTAPAASSPVMTGPGQSCWRCQGALEVGSEYCKFCGARHGDAPQQRQVAPVATAQSGVSVAVPSLVSIRKDGSDGQAFALPEEGADIGSTEGDILLGDDPYLSSRHARVRRQGREFFLRDLDSANGVYLRLREAAELRHCDHILIGQQVLRYEVLDEVEMPLGPAKVRGVMAFGTPEVPRFARLVQYSTEGIGRDIYSLYRDETILGRENGDIVFTDDPFLSRRHASISIDRGTGRVVLQDLGSSNGTSLRLRGERVLRSGDQFRVGRHLFRFDLPEGQGGR